MQQAHACTPAPRVSASVLLHSTLSSKGVQVCCRCTLELLDEVLQCSAHGLSRGNMQNAGLSLE